MGNLSVTEERSGIRFPVEAASRAGRSVALARSLYRRAAILVKKGHAQMAHVRQLRRLIQRVLWACGASLSPTRQPRRPLDHASM
jgi:hypothetical protein